MKLWRIVFIFLLILFYPAFAKDTLLDNPIGLKENGSKFCDFCTDNIKDIDLEKFIKEQIENDYVIVSLDECIMVALRNNFNIKISNHEFLSSKYQFENRLSQFLPYLDTTSYISDYQGQILVDGVLKDIFHETAVSFNITLAHDLTKGGSEIFEAKAAKYFERAKRHDLNFTKARTVYLTARYYYEMLLSKINIEIYLRNLIERNAQLVLSINLQKSGFGTQFDVIRAKSEMLSAKVELLRALNNFRISEANLANIMGINVEVALMPIESSANKLELIKTDISTDELFSLALENREDLKSYKNLINYEKQIKYSYFTEFMPKPYISYQEQWQGTIGGGIRPNYILTLFMNWNLGRNLGFGTITKIKEQKENVKVRVLQFQNTLRNIEQDLIKARSSAIFNEQETDIAKTRLDYAHETVKLSMLRFDNGKGILLDVIQAQSQVTLARVQYVNAVINYNLSQLELLYDLGLINPDDIIKNYKP